ncbi:hypothetical protein GALMADRAFT_150403 [Galerina marginata CBS 339.88]|uniref:Uncharacterized protein n=1 Tax=Galerina marginata (strain CBS 339.88) TaxID=685588 RepID=A0A067TSE2_GALM3|nr:hypothetical protein GALMADRAFT_150403 [Galerina marginata CBS 339.88]
MASGKSFAEERNLETRTCIACGFVDSYDRFESHSQCRFSNGESCSACKKLKLLESQILEAKRTLDDLIRQHQDLKTQKNRIHDPITSRMPPEVVSTIFEFCLPPTPCDSDHFLTPSKGNPLKLGAVCRAWREIAWSTPRLWTVISVCVNAPGLAARCDLARGWLVRSGGLPLTIHIFTSISCSTDTLLTSPDTLHFIKLINQHSNRWQRLDLSVPFPLVSEFCGDSNPVSIMRTLRIDLERIRGIRSGGQFSMRNVKPHPTNVSLSSLRLKAVDIEWNNVTQAVVKDLQVDECFELLRRAPKLRRCKLASFSTYRPGQEQFPIPENIIVHHQLRNLSLEFPVGSDAVSSICNKVSFPALLRLSCTMDECIVPTQSLVSFLKRSSCALEKLLIMDASFDNDDMMIDLLQATPSLVRLDLLPHRWANYSPDRLFERLARTSIAKDEDNIFLPKLRFFRYHVEENISWDLVPGIFGSLHELDNPRRRPLESVWIHFDREVENGEPLRYIDKNTLPRLLSILEAGLDLDVGYPTEDLDLIEESMKYHDMVDDEDHPSSEN